MTDDELMDALGWLYDYDTSSRESTADGEDLRKRVMNELTTRRGPYEIVPNRIVGVVIRELFLTDEKLDAEYGPEDVAEFLGWLDRYMGFDLSW